MANQQTLANESVLLDEFKILGQLGSGGFANTYLAQDLSLGREVAIKEFFPSSLAVRLDDSERVAVRSPDKESQFQWALRRFVREAKTLAKFRHPSVVRVFRVFNANDTAYIVLEFVRGSNMESWLKQLGRRPTQKEFDDLIPPLLDALEVVHSAGILHRDIKPANIYIRAVDHSPVLLDFGAAGRVTGSGPSGISAALVSKGYSPGEAYSTDSRLQGPWTDIYGLAATIYRALAGAAPTEAAKRTIEENYISALQLDGARDYRPAFLRAIDRALQLMPRDRPQSIVEWRNELLAETGARARIVDANGDPTTIAEWHPISEQPTEAPTHTSAGSLDRRPPTAQTGESRETSASSQARPRTGEIVTGHPAPGRKAAARRSGLTDHRIFAIGLALFALGGLALAGQLLFNRPAGAPVSQGESSPGNATGNSPGQSVTPDRDREAEARRIQDEAATKRRQDFEARARAEAERKSQEQADALRREQEAQRAATEAEAKRKAQQEAEAKRKAQQEAEAKRRAEDEAVARRAADEQAEARRRAEDEVRAKADPERTARERFEAEQRKEEAAHAKAAAEREERALFEARRREAEQARDSTGAEPRPR